MLAVDIAPFTRSLHQHRRSLPEFHISRPFDGVGVGSLERCGEAEQSNFAPEQSPPVEGVVRIRERSCWLWFG